MPITYNPGPSQSYPKLPEYLEAAVADGILELSHRSQRYQEVHRGTVEALRLLMGIPQDYEVWFLASATEAMERIIQNTASLHSHHVITGAFSDKFASMATNLGKTVSCTAVEWGDGVNLDELDAPPTAELIAVTHNETSTGVALPTDQINRLGQRYANSLIAVDMVSSAPFSGVDLSSIDLAFFSVQKAFGLPAGLSVLIASPRALYRARQRAAEGQVIGSYHSFPELAKMAAKSMTPETPNVLAIYLLGRVAQDLLAHNPAMLREQLASQASQLYQLLECHPHLSLLVSDPAYRSNSVIVAEVAGGNHQLLDSLSSRGHHLGKGYAHQKASHIRIANFPAHAGTTAELLVALESFRLQ